MTRSLFNTGWLVGPKTGIFAPLEGGAEPAQPVTLPHDALIGAARSPQGPGKTAYYPASAAFEYTKTFGAPDDWRGRRVSLEFQGAYRDAMVFVNDQFAGQRPYGYSTFVVPLDDHLLPGQENTVRVEVRAHDDSRWYTGAGLIRDVVLLVTDPCHLVTDGVVATTPDVDDERAVVEVTADVVNRGTGAPTLTAAFEIRGPDGGTVASATSPVTVRGGATERVRLRLYVPRPRRWSVADPNLYLLQAVLRQGEVEVDRQTVPLGIRTLRLDPEHGLRINEEIVKLRGACLHHDNGPLGATAWPRAEERRVELLKAAGFNAIRSTHNPASQPLLDACDRLGLLVVDETFDVWTESKNGFDYSLSFPEWWERDVEAMVRKDRNHPCVILYSIGNEIPETGTPLGAALGRKLAEKIRSLDSTRYVTNAVNPLVSVLKEVTALRERGAGGVNQALGSPDDAMNQIGASALATAKTEESFAALDVAGLNYSDRRYALDQELFPTRTIVGSETFPGHIDVNWRLVKRHPHVIGDFTWTGWDYLGEVGLGRVRYEGESATLEAPYPWRTAWCGDIDITGHRRPISYYRETVFGLRHEPYLAVHRPQTHGRPPLSGGWAWSDTVNSWSWPLASGTPMEVDVYTDAEEVELFLDARSVGRVRVGGAKDFLASFDFAYQPGELTAVTFIGGREQARTTLRSASRGEEVLDLHADRDVLRADGRDLAFVAILLTDDAGTVLVGRDRDVEVSVSGAAVLQGLASARPDSEESFAGSRCTTFDGMALAIVRATATGSIVVKVRMVDGPERVIRLEAVNTAPGSSPRHE